MVTSCTSIFFKFFVGIVSHKFFSGYFADIVIRDRDLYKDFSICLKENIFPLPSFVALRMISIGVGIASTSRGFGFCSKSGSKYKYYENCVFKIFCCEVSPIEKGTSVEFRLASISTKPIIPILEI